jgi:hypothetical protein
VNARSHHADRVPLHGHGARRVDLQRHRLLRLQARPALGARLVLSRRQHLHHRDEPQPHAQLRRLLPGTYALLCSDSASASAYAAIFGLRCLCARVAEAGILQISKLSMIPVVCLMEWVLNSKHYTTKVISAVVVVAAGVGICTVTDVEVNAKGFICACVAVFCTSLQQIVSSSPFFTSLLAIAPFFGIVYSIMMIWRILVLTAIMLFCNLQRDLVM